jgi:SAM-dependent methyltransferase
VPAERPATAIDADAVAAHYAGLAPTYARRANRACTRAYVELARRHLGACRRVAEVGAGASDLLAGLPRALRVGCDASLPMLASARRREWLRAAALADRLPFAVASLDGLIAINLLEHLTHPGHFLREAARVLAPGGRLVAVTPNGDLEWLLDRLERLRLKLPEGPHRFLRQTELRALLPAELRLVEQRAFLALPAGPPWLVRAVDRLVAGSRGRGLFQFLVAERGADVAP